MKVNNGSSNIQNDQDKNNLIEKEEKAKKSKPKKKIAFLDDETENNRKENDLVKDLNSEDSQKIQNNLNSSKTKESKNGDRDNKTENNNQKNSIETRENTLLNKNDQNNQIIEKDGGALANKQQKMARFKESMDNNADEEMPLDRGRSRTNVKKKYSESLDLNQVVMKRSKSCDTGKNFFEKQSKEIDEIFEVLNNFQSLRLK